MGDPVSPKNLAQMALTRAWGGLEMMALQYALRFSDRGYRPFIITLKDSPLEVQANHHRIPVLTVPECRYFSPLTTYRIRHFIRQNEIDSLFVHHLRDLWLLRPALVGHPDICLIGFAHMFLQNIKKTDRLHRWLYTRLKNLVALTELQKRELLKCLPLPEEKITVIPNGIDFQKFSPSKRNEDFRQRLFKVGPHQPVVGVVGRLDPQKGQLEFLYAARKVVELEPQTTFVLIGRPNRNESDYYLKIKKFIAESRLEKNIRMIDHMEDVTATMASLDIFVLPSYKEAFGNVLIEAMASGVPVIATDAGGPSEIVVSGSTGLLIPPKDQNAMINAILSLLHNRDSAQFYARNALSTGLKKFAVEGVLNSVEFLLTKHRPRAEGPFHNPQSISAV